jgi:hypothetical protein
MSLVVGFPCCDGVVIACDLASTARVNGSLTRQKFFCDKFVVSPAGQWSCAWAGSRTSIIAATKMGLVFGQSSAENRLSQQQLTEELQKIGDQAFRERLQEDPNLSETSACLIAYDHGPGTASSPVGLYELSISSTSTCTRIRTGTPKYLGDYVNPAAFFGWSLYGGLFLRRHALVEDCAFLAGFIITAAHNFNPMAVDGLAVMVCTPNSFTTLDETLIDEIKQQSDEIGKGIWADLHAKSKSFAARIHSL